MNILIIEDELPAAEKLTAALRRIDPSITIGGIARSVNEGIAWLRRNGPPDLVLADIQLGDGQSFEIFAEVDPRCPIVFTTAYDEYLLKAFEFTAIDYLLKPVRDEKLAAALQKYGRVREHFERVNADSLRPLIDAAAGKLPRRNRIIVRKGTGFGAVAVGDIAWFFTVNKVSFLIDKKGARYIIDHPLSDLEQELDRARFFRANRKYLVNIDAIERYSSRDKGKVLLELSPPAPEEVIVSQENGSAFREWISGA